MKKIIVVSTVLIIVFISTNIQAMNHWVGRWKFDECWPSKTGEVHNCVVYVLNIKPIGNKLIVDIDIDGYQILRRIRGVVRVTEKGIAIVFLGVRKGDSGKIYEKEEVLVELNRHDGSVLTTWRTLQPMLDEYRSVGVYFQKTR